MRPQRIDEVAHRVRQFREACSFPGYEEVENCAARPLTAPARWRILGGRTGRPA